MASGISMMVLVACEFSGIVRDVDLLQTERPDWGNHICDEVERHLEDGWDLMIAHPPCTYLSVSGLHWNKRGRLVNGRPRAELTEKALHFVRTLMDAPINRIALENPIGCISTRIKKPTQVIQPWMFGEDASKTTCLWLKNLPPLRPTKEIRRPRWIKCPCCQDYLVSDSSAARF